MSAEQPSKPAGRSGLPMGSTVAIGVAVVAVILGLLVLKKLSDDDGTTTKPQDTVPALNTTLSTTVDLGTGGTADTSGGTPSTDAGTLTPSIKGSPVQVANASPTSGVAKLASNLLKDKGYTTSTPISSSTKLTTTVVYYVSGNTAAQKVALAVKRDMCIKGDPKEQPATLALDPKPDAGTGVIVMLGSDKAGKTLQKMCAGASSTTSDTTAGGGSTATAGT